MTPRIKGVAVRDVGVMRGLLMRAGLMVLGGFGVMVRRLGLMFGGEMVVLDCLFGLRHVTSPPYSRRSVGPGNKSLEHPNTRREPFRPSPAVGAFQAIAPGA